MLRGCTSVLFNVCARVCPCACVRVCVCATCRSWRWASAGGSRATCSPAGTFWTGCWCLCPWSTSWYPWLLPEETAYWGSLGCCVCYARCAHSGTETPLLCVCVCVCVCVCACVCVCVCVRGSFRKDNSILCYASSFVLLVKGVRTTQGTLVVT